MSLKSKEVTAYMEFAFSIAKMSHAIREKVGCVIAKENGVIIGYGYNGMPTNMDNSCEDKVYENTSLHTIDAYPFEDNIGRYYLKTKKEVLHAESNAISKIAKSNMSCDGATAIITLQPCLDCAKLLLQAGIKEVIYANHYRDSSGVDFLVNNSVKCDVFVN